MGEKKEHWPYWSCWVFFSVNLDKPLPVYRIGLAFNLRLDLATGNFLVVVVFSSRAEFGY